MDIVQEAIKRTGKTPTELFEDAYKAMAKKDATIEPHNWRWSMGLWHRSGIITRTMQLYCENLLSGGEQLSLPLDFPDHHIELAGDGK